MGRKRKPIEEKVAVLRVSMKNKDIVKLGELRKNTPSRAAREVLEKFIKDNDDSC